MSSKEKDHKSYELPQATVVRLVKKANPAVNIKKDAKEAIAKVAGIFVLYLSHNANLISQRSNRQTIQAKDVFEALKDIEFGDFCEDLEQQLTKWKKEQEIKKQTKQLKKAKKLETIESASISIPINNKENHSNNFNNNLQSEIERSDMNAAGSEEDIDIQ